jgi:HK97 family phage prohead protease
MRLYGNIQKVDAERRMVFGYASTEAVDAHGEIVLKSAIEAALDDYLEFANLREMHQLSAVGTTEEASVDDKGLYIAAKVVDDVAWGKVTAGVYKGFSIGGKVLARDPDDKKIVTKIQLFEISLVDRPSNPEARFDVWKAAVTDQRDPFAKATAALAAVEEKIATLRSADLQKSMYHVGRFAELLKSLSYLAASAQSEAEFEADDSKVPAQLRDWLSLGSAIFKEMAAEEVDEFLAGFRVEKATAASADLTKKAPDALVKLVTAQTSTIAKQAGELAEARTEMEQLKKSLVEPAPAKTAGAFAFVAISKQQDAAGAAALQKAASVGDLVEALSAMDPEERALLLIKASHQLPQQLLGANR